MITRGSVDAVDEVRNVSVTDVFVLVEIRPGACHHFTPVAELVVLAEFLVQPL